MHPRFVVLPLICFAVVACASRGGVPQDFLTRFSLTPEPGAANFQVCTSFACESSEHHALSDEEREKLRLVFNPPAGNATEERLRIAEAIGLMERMLGSRAGTAFDAARNAWVKGKPRGQLDCVAETANTTTYMLIMSSMGLLRFHTVAHPDRRGVIPFNSHNTAVIAEVATGRKFAVDPWFDANGKPAHIVPLPLWLDGWEPGENDQDA